MARKATVSSIVTQIRQRADIENSQFVTDAELIGWIDYANTALYDAIVSRYNDYFVKSSVFALVGNQDTYSLPSDFYKLLGCEHSVDGDRWRTMVPFNFNERNRLQSAKTNLAYYANYRYHVMNDEIKFNPIPDGGANIRVWYVPAPTKITQGTDEINGFSGWEEYIILDCAAKAQAKAELDPSFYLSERNNVMQRILAMAQNYDAGPAQRVTDIYAINDDVFYPLLSL